MDVFMARTTRIPEIPAVFGWRRVTLRRDAEAAGEARHVVGRWLASAESCLRWEALEVVSELVTNAVRHVPVGAGRDWVTVVFGVGDGFVRLEVVDPGTSEREPRFVPLEVGALAESGRGLGLVAAQSVRWGTRLVECGHRVVWADLAVSGS